MRKYLIPFLCVVLVIAVIAVIVYAVGPTSVNYSMTAYLITADGTVESSFPITIQGKILEKDGKTYLSLDIDLPKDFRYSFAEPTSDGEPAISAELLTGNSGDIYSLTETYDSETTWSSACHYAINTKKGYFFACWPDDSGAYLVASTDPNTTPQALATYFERYVQEFYHSEA